MKLPASRHATGATTSPMDVHYFIFSPPRSSFELEQYNPKYWAGIDCSGLVQRSVNKADLLGISGASSTIPVLDTRAVYSQELIMNCADQCSGDYVFKMPYDAQREPQTVGMIRKGDFVGYERHISLVHSSRPTCVSYKKKKKTINTCNYDIIHSSGSDQLCYNTDDPASPIECQFNRKVVKNPINNALRSNSLKTPKGFGRIKLW